MVLRLWQDLLADYDPSIDNFSNQPLTIIASNLEVKTFHGLSLATRKNIYLIQNPPLPEVMDPKIWYAENKAIVTQWIETKAYEININFFPMPETEEILDLNAALEAFKTSKTVWVKTKVCISVTRNHVYEVLCANCRLVVNAGLDWNVKCTACMVLSPMEVRYNMPVTLNDGDTSIRSTIKSPDAEKLTKISAAEFKKLEDEGMSPINDLIIAVDYTEIICFLKYYDKVYAGVKSRRYVILKTYTLDEVRPVTLEESSTMEPEVNLDSSDAIVVDARKQIFEADTMKESNSETPFFTPTTKKALEEVAADCEAQGSTSTHSGNVKRTIQFGTITAADLNIQPTEIQLVQESPNKKNKGEQQEV